MLTTVLPLLGQSEEAAVPYYELDPMIIESSPLATEVADLTQSWSAREGAALERIRAQTIGETLAFEPGVAQSFYGPNASRPIIRGLDGYRVRVLQNGLDAFDVSAASVDHAVAIDPMLIERVEILRGSSALLYGANAVGGVVNTIDRTIPTHALDDPLEGQARVSHTTVDEGWHTGGVVFSGTDDFVFQVNGTFRETNDYDVPSFNLPDGTRTDTIDNSDSETWTGGLGGSYLFENGYIGVAYSHFDTEYGVPNEEAPTIDLERKRFELRGAVTPESVEWLDNIELQLAYGDYDHDEIEPSGETAVTFEREGIESRLAFVHSFEDLKGVIGFQGTFDETSIRGEENFLGGVTGVNPTIEEEDAQRLALFAKEEYTVDEQFSINGGLRLETLLRQYKGTSDEDEFTVSGSGGIVFKPAEGWSISGNVNYTQRPPETAELFSDGPHLATEAFEIGDSSLDTETAIGFEFIVRRTKGPVTGHISAFFTHFDDYIFLADTGNQVDADGNLDPDGELEERVYRGVSAEFYGVEGEVIWRAFEEADWTIDLRSFGDVLSARNTSDDDHLPRTPPWRLGGGVDVGYQAFSFGVDLTHTGKQTDTAPEEDSTSSYTLLDARVAYSWKTEDVEAEIFIKASNLTDDLARVHTSFLRDTAPLPGRSVEVGLNVMF